MPAVKYKTWETENRAWYESLASRHLDSVPFLASVRNSVGRQSFYKSRPKNVSRALSGEILGRTSISHETRKNLAYADANRALLTVNETLTIHDLRLSWDDNSLTNWAEAKAARCEKIISVDAYAMHLLKKLVDDYGFDWPCRGMDLFGDSGAVLRVCDVRWWRRKARVAKVRAIDQLARSFRMVHAKAQTYCSNEAVKLRRVQAKRNRSTLEGFEAINQEGDSYTLAELSDLSISNPVNRRHELMVRMRGFEELAEQFGHEGLFITLSAPSRFHPMRQIKNAAGKLVRVDENPKYQGATPRDAQDWLNKTWQLIRAELDREEIRCYGFRVVEPHSDGTPHWHQLLFFAVDDIEKVKTIFKNYSLRTDSQEAGAAQYRLKIVSIDRSRGSAAGYIAKYISKGIDGNHIESDLLGNAGVTAAERICAWASAWGIRQFQQIGGGTVTVWRELRRLDIAEGVTEQARHAADSSDWAAYCLLQGGGLPFVRRATAPIQAAYWLEHDAATGEEIDPSFSQYGEQSKGKIFGVFSATESKYFLTRFFRWTVRRIGAAVGVIKKALPVCTLSPDDLLDLMRGDGFGSTA